MDSMEVDARLKYAACSIVVTRADGTVEDLGVVAEYRRPHLLKRLWLRLSGRN